MHNMVPLPSSVGTNGLPLTIRDAETPYGKRIGLAVVKRGAKDYLEFLDATKEAFYAYLYHRTGSVTLAQTVMGEVFLSSLTKSMSLLRIGGLTFRSLLDTADIALRDRDIAPSDIDSVYLQNLPWLTSEDRSSVSSLHEALWTLPIAAQRILILSILVGFPVERTAEALGQQADRVREELETAKDLLFTRWQPTAAVRLKIDSVAFVPGIDIRAETQLRFQVVEKYSALRFRRAQWVILGALFAALSNVIVASTIAFAVVTQPTLRHERLELAGMDALLTQRELAVQEARQSLTASSKEARRIVAHTSTRDFTSLGLAVGLKVFQEESVQEEAAESLIDRLKQLTARLAPIVKPAVVAMLRAASVALGKLPAHPL